MPYYITDQNPECTNWAVVKEDNEVIGCHNTKEGAIDQAIAVALSEGSTFEGELRIESGPPAVIADIDGTLISFEGNRIDEVENYLDSFEDTEIIIITARIAEDRAETVAELESLDIDYDQLFMKPDAETDSTEWKKSVAQELLKTYNIMVAVDDNDEIREEYADLGITAIAPSQVPASTYVEDDEMRQVNLTPPAYMRAAARQGLKYYEEGLAGDGLVARTVREARAMANGTVTADKWVRIRAWIARHLGDLDSPDANPNSDRYPSPGVVAHLLWGSGPSKSAARRALDYAEGVVSRIEAENEGRAKGEALSKIETRIRATDFEIRESESGGMLFEGYAAVFNSPSEPLPFTERIAPGAFRGSLKQRNDIKMLWNHDTGAVLGSTRAKTLELYEDEKGLRVRAQLPNTTLGRDTAELIRRGDVNAMSFGFSVAQNGDSWNDAGTERTLHKVRLHEVSIVAFPAYSATSGTASVRGLDKVATRAEVDADELADALLKIESGLDITLEEKSLITKVLDTLAPEVSTPQDEFDGQAWLALKKKKLETLIKKA